MRVLVLGAGVVGVTAAWYLSQDGHQVTVLDRHPGAALETSFANGGQISASHAEPWANPDAPSNVPLVGATRYRNRFLDTGHGTLGWTMACGSGRALADMIAGRKPAVDFAFTRGVVRRRGIELVDA